MKVEYWGFITRKMVQDHPNWIFLFGDNLQARGFGGQAKEMRGEPNAIGIPTKKEPSNFPWSFFTDDEYTKNCMAIDRAFFRIPKNPEKIIIPRAGIGTGLAQLQDTAPRTFEYLQSRLAELANGETGDEKGSGRA